MQGKGRGIELRGLSETACFVSSLRSARERGKSRASSRNITCPVAKATSPVTGPGTASAVFAPLRLELSTRHAKGEINAQLRLATLKVAAKRAGSEGVAASLASQHSPPALLTHPPPSPDIVDVPGRLGACLFRRISYGVRDPFRADLNYGSDTDHTE